MGDSFQHRTLGILLKEANIGYSNIWDGTKDF